MRRLLISAAFLLAPLAQPALAQKGLPETLPGWEAGAFVPEPVIKADPGILRECGIEETQTRAYSRGGTAFTATLYRAHDSTSGYELYTSLQTDALAPGDLTPHSSISRDRALILLGNLVLDVDAGPNTGTAGLRKEHDALRALVAQLTPQADHTPYPTLAQYFPAEGLDRHSERYALGPVALVRALPMVQSDWIGFNDGAEAEVAHYRVEGEDASLILISYPTPQVAAHHVTELSRWFSFEGLPGQNDARPTIYVRRANSLVAIVTQAHSRAAAEALLEKVHYESELTWNEPRHTLTDPSWGTVIVGIFAGTGAIMIFSIFVGLGFGGLRLLIKYLLPGKVFDRPERMEILQLGLSSKPIQAKDFY